MKSTIFSILTQTISNMMGVVVDSSGIFKVFSTKNCFFPKQYIERLPDAFGTEVPGLRSMYFEIGNLGKMHTMKIV